MSGEVRKAIGALDVLAKHLAYEGKIVHGETMHKLTIALEALLECIKGIEEDIYTINERLCALEPKDEQKPVGFVDKG